MRIAYLVETYPKLSETFVAAEAAAVADAGHEVRIFAWRSEGPPDPAAYYGSWRSTFRKPVRLARAGARTLRNTSGPREIAVAVLQAARLRAAISAYAPDVIHAHFATAPTAVGLTLARMLPTHVTATFHANDYLVGTTARQLAERVESLDAVFGISNASCVEIAARAGVERSRIGLVRASISPSVAELLDIPSSRVDGMHLVSVGRLVPKKGHAELIAGVHRYRQRHPSEALSLRIIGDGPQHDELTALVAELQLGDIVTLCGALPHTQAVEMIRRSSAAVLCCVVTGSGDADGIPVFLMEAAAAGLPIATTAVGGIADLVQDDVTGVLMPGTTPDDVADGLERLASPRAPALAEAGRRRVAQEFHPRVQVQRLEAAWRQVLDQEL